MKLFDLPPVWLAATLVIAWFWRWPAAWDGWALPGALVVVVAIVLFLLATLEFARARTTIMPGQASRALITSGVFRFIRNPIYLADVLILVGLSLRWGSVVGLAFVPPLILLLHRRFILPEEARLNAAFGSEFEDYAARTRRWV